MTNPCVDFCYIHLNKQYSSDCDDKCEYAKVMKEKKLFEESIDKLVKSLAELSEQFCCLTECKNCPVMIHDYETKNKT